MASGGRAGRASPRTSFASELSSRLDEAAAGHRARRPPPPGPHPPPLPDRGYRRDCVRRAPPLCRRLAAAAALAGGRAFAGWEVDACGYANAPPTFLALPAPPGRAFRWKSFSCSEGCTFKVSSFLRRGRLCVVVVGGEDGDGGEAEGEGEEGEGGRLGGGGRLRLGAGAPLLRLLR